MPLGQRSLFNQNQSSDPVVLERRRRVQRDNGTIVFITLKFCAVLSVDSWSTSVREISASLKKPERQTQTASLYKFF